MMVELFKKGSVQYVTIGGINYRTTDPVAQQYLAEHSETPVLSRPAMPSTAKRKTVQYITINGINYRITDPVAQQYLAEHPETPVLSRPAMPSTAISADEIVAPEIVPETPTEITEIPRPASALDFPEQIRTSPVLEDTISFEDTIDIVRDGVNLGTVNAMWYLSLTPDERREWETYQRTFVYHAYPATSEQRQYIESLGLVVLDTGEKIYRYVFDSMPEEEQQTVMQSGIAGWQEKYTVLTGYTDPETGEAERIRKEVWDILDTEDKERIKQSGLEAVLEAGELIPAEVKANYVQLDNGQWVDKTFFDELQSSNPEAAAYLKMYGIDKFNAEYNAPLDTDTLELMVTQTGGDLSAFRAIENYDEKLQYIKGLQTTYNETVVQQLGGNVDEYNAIETEEGKQAYIVGLQEQFEQTHIQVGPEGKKEWMLQSDYNNLPFDIKQTISSIGITGYLQQHEDALSTLSEFATTVDVESWHREGEPSTIPQIAHNLWQITYEQAQNPEIRSAVSVLYPSVDLDKLGKEPMDSEAYQKLKALSEKENPTRSESIILSALNKPITEYYPIQAITPTEYVNKEKSLLDAGLSQAEVDKTMSNFYKATSDIEEYQQYSESGNVQFIPSMWQRMTPWKEEEGETVTLARGADMAADFLLPGYYAATNWNDLSNAERALNIVLDAVVLLPFVGAAGLAAKSVSTASRTARIAAIASAVSREAISQVKAPLTMLIHPIGTAKATYRTIADVVSDILDPRKLPEAVVTTSNNAVMLRIGDDLPLTEAMVMRDDLVDMAIRGEYPAIQFTDAAGNGYRIELTQSPLMQEIGGGAVHSTPYGQEWMQQIKNQGYAIVANDIENSRMYFSAEPHSRFALSSAAGGTGELPTIMIFGKDNPIIDQLEYSGKIWKSPSKGLVVEIEKTLAAGKTLAEAEPAQVLYTRVGVNREPVQIWLMDVKLSPAQIAKLKALNLVEMIKSPFKAPVKVAKFGDYTLYEDEIRALAKIIDEVDPEIAKRIRLLADQGDIFREATIAVRANDILTADPYMLERYDTLTGERLGTDTVIQELSRAGYDRAIRPETLNRVTRIGIADRVPRIAIDERVARPERLVEERAVRVEDTRYPERLVVPSDTERVRVEEPSEPERIIRTEEPERIERPKIIKEPERLRIPDREERLRIPEEPSRPKFVLKKKQFDDLTEKERNGSVAWKQGWCYKLIYPPYGQNNIINSRYPFPGMKVHKDAKSAFRTLTQIVEGTLPPTISIDMGIMDIDIRTTKEPRGKGVGKAKLQMEYTLDRYQQTSASAPRITQTRGSSNR